VLKRVVIAEAVEVLCECARDVARPARTRTIHETGRALVGTALHPCAEGRVGTVEGRRDGVDMVASNDLPYGLRPAKAPSLRGLLQDGLSGRQRMLGKVAFEGAHGFAPWKRRTVVSHMTCGA
jgi:hypothetical protein